MRSFALLLLVPIALAGCGNKYSDVPEPTGMWTAINPIGFVPPSADPEPARHVAYRRPWHRRARVKPASRATSATRNVAPAGAPAT